MLNLFWCILPHPVLSRMKLFRTGLVTLLLPLLALLFRRDAARPGPEVGVEDPKRKFGPTLLRDQSRCNRIGIPPAGPRRSLSWNELRSEAVTATASAWAKFCAWIAQADQLADSAARISQACGSRSQQSSIQAAMASSASRWHECRTQQMARKSDPPTPHLHRSPVDHPV